MTMRIVLSGIISIIILLCGIPAFADTSVGGRISADTTWTLANSPYVVTSTVQVYGTTTSPVTLTIEPGVVVKFNSGVGLYVGYSTNQGALVAQGTATQRITLTRSGTSGTWAGITFHDGTVDAATIMDNADILYSSGMSLSSASPTIRNSTITNMSGYLSLSSSNPALQNVSISNTSTYGLYLASSSPVLSNVTLTTTGAYGMYLSSSNPVITGGSLVNTSVSGHGIYGSGSPVVSNYNVSITNAPNYYGLYLNSGSTSSLSITDSTIANGLYLNTPNITPTITGNTIMNADNAPIRAGANIIAAILNNNTVTGMTSAGRIEVVGEQVKQDVTWRKWPASYVVTSALSVYKDAATAATLTIEPGTTIKFNSGVGLQIGNGTSKGALVAQGTDGNRITFTRSGASGTWGSMIFYDGTIDNTTVFEYVDIQYSTGISVNAASPTFKNSTILNLTGYVSLSSSNPTFQDVSISNTSTYGLYLASSSPVLSNVTLTTSGAYGMYLSSANPVITGGSLANTSASGHGIYGTGSPVVSNYNVSITNAPNYYGLYLSSGSTSSLSITNSTIANSLYLGTMNITPTITGNTFTNVDNAPLHAGANIIAGILNNNTIAGMTSAGRIEVVGEQVKQDARWMKMNAPYVVTSGTIAVYKDAAGPATLTIDPGVLVKFATGAGLQIASGANQGALIAQGTAANRITFTRNGTSGAWGSITFYDGTVDNATILENVDIHYSTGLSINSSSPAFKNSTITNLTGHVSMNFSNPVLDAVTISNTGTYGIYLSSSNPVIANGSLTNSSSTGHGIYGGGSPVISNYSVSIVNAANYYGIYLSSATSTLSLTNSTIANGLFLNATGITPTITGNTITNVDNSPIRAGANIIADILNNNTITGMTSAGRIEVVGETINRDARWIKRPAPYVIPSGTMYVYKDTTAPATLILDPGVILRFGQYANMQIGNGASKGKLIAQGTATDKILFTSNQTTPTAGYWYGITFSGDAAGSSTLEHATIEYAGPGAAYSSANVTLSSSSPVIRNCLIRNSAGSGVYVTGATNYPVIIDSEITGNKWGVYSSSSNPYITNTKIHSNTTAGVWNMSTTMDVDARDNWWGISTGPTYSANPRGTGDKVNDRVLYNPWLGQTPGAALTLADAKVLPASLNPDGDYVTFSASISSTATWTIFIVDETSASVKTFSGIGTSINQRWYGDNDQSVKVADGAYYFTISAIDSNNNTSSSPQGMLMVSRQIPIAVMDPPQDNQMEQCGSTIAITGTASDSSNFKNYSLDYGAGENPAAWTNLKTSTTAATNSLLHTWNTSALTSTIYTVRLTVSDNAGNIATETSRVRFLCIRNAAASEAFLSPNTDGIKDGTTVTASITQPSAWTITIRDQAQNTVRTYTGISAFVTQTWDGKNEADQVVPDGTYTYQVDATGSGTTIAAVPVTGTVTVDTTMPAAQIAAPSVNAVLWNDVQVMGTADDANLNNYRLEYGPATGTGPWTLITTATVPVNSSPLGTWITNDQANAVTLQNGNYLLRLVVTDKAGNSTAYSVPVNMDNLILSNVGASSHTIDTQIGQTSTLSYSVNSQATVTLRIVPETQGPAGTPIYTAAQTAPSSGSYTFTWDGKDSTGKAAPDEAYLYIMEASNGTRTDSYNPDAPTVIGTVTCSQSSGLDPAKNVPLIVTYTPSRPSRININISWGSLNFKILDAGAATAGSHEYVWDGRSPSNKLLDVGAQSSCTVTTLLRENHFITSGDTVRVTELKTDPYVQQLSYGQITRITYTLSRDAIATVTLTSPSGAVITLRSNELQAAGSQTLEWSGMDTADASGKRALVTEEGDYMVTVQTVNPVTGTSSTTKGNLRIGL